MTCPNCGFENKSDAVTCFSCGNQLTELSPIEENIDLEAVANEKKFNQSDLVNPSIVEKDVLSNNDDELFGSSEQYTLRSSETYNDVLNIYEPEKKNESTDIFNADSKKSNDQISMQELIDTIPISDGANDKVYTSDSNIYREEKNTTDLNYNPLTQETTIQGISDVASASIPVSNQGISITTEATNQNPGFNNFEGNIETVMSNSTQPIIENSTIEQPVQEPEQSEEQKILPTSRREKRNKKTDNNIDSSNNSSVINNNSKIDTTIDNNIKPKQNNIYFNIEPEVTDEQTINPSETTSSNEKKLSNPVAEVEDTSLDSKVNLFILIKLMIGAFIKPGTTIRVNTRAYTDTKVSSKIYLFFSGLTFVAFMAANLFNSCFTKVYDININSYTTTFTIDALKSVDYMNMALIGALLTFGVTLLTSIVYYIASFLTNKGLSFGRYLAVITLCLLPFYLCTCIIGPLASIPSYYIGVAVNFLGITYSFIILITTLNDLLTFKDINQKIFYHTIILSIVFTVIGIVISIFLKDLLTALKLVM